MFTFQSLEAHNKPGREVIHSGHFMVSHFEAEEQDDEDELAVPVPEVKTTTLEIVPEKPLYTEIKFAQICGNNQQLSIDTSLSKLFQCMSLAYRQKLTSPKWNRFRGIRLRWKDKIRLNNVIWRCWHMQFIKKKNTLICQFASPLDVDTHNKPEAIVLEGKYWKRKLAAVTAEYKKWRMFYRNHLSGHTPKECSDMLNDMDMLNWNSQNSMENMHMMVDEDYMGLMSDTLFSTITNQPFVFPDSREIAKAGLADFIQPSLGPLQPNLDDYMDTFEPLQELISGKLPTVPEEHPNDTYKSLRWYYTNESPVQEPNSLFDNMLQTPHIMNEYQQIQNMHSVAAEKSVQIQDTRQQIAQTPTPNYNTEILIQQQQQTTPVQVETYVTSQRQNPPPYQPSVISKTTKHMKNVAGASRMGSGYNKSLENAYTGYQTSGASNLGIVEDQQIQEQQIANQRLDLQSFKLPQATEYKLTQTGQVSTKFTTQEPEKLNVRNVRNASHRGRQRSKSTSREPMKGRPPLLSAISDPQLMTSNSSVLLTQLLTNNTDAGSIFARGQSGTLVRELKAQIRVKEENAPVPIMAQPNTTTTTLIITTPVMNTVQTPANDPLLLTSTRTSSSPILDSNSQGLNSPTSSQGSLGSPNRDGSQRGDHRKIGHIHAEQKRRYNIKNGFDMIHSLIPHLHQNPNAKLSKAAMLQKGAEYIRQLRAERNQLRDEMENLREQIETLNTSISNCQSLLPATGAPVSRRRDSKMQEMFDEYVRSRTMSDNWKFWIFSLLFKPLLLSFNNFVSTSSLEDLYHSTMLWIEQHCTLGDLRPVVLNSLRYLCTKTEILTEPEKLPEEARQAVSLDSQSHHLKC